MRRALLGLLVLVLATPGARATGLLIPKETTLPPLALLNQSVTVNIQDQVAITRIEQTFRNHTDRELEATYLFPVPKGASVREFAMWVDGKEVKGELVEAKEARRIYESIVQQTKDPGLLEYLDHKLIRLRVFPVPPKHKDNGDQKVSLSYTSVCNAENGLIEYLYPTKTDGRSARTLEKFSLKVIIKSQTALTSIYSPSHGITIRRPNDKEAEIAFEKDQAILDRDFQLYFANAEKDIGLTAAVHRPNGDQPGHFMLLLSPRAELSKSQTIPRDMVFVIDTSGSMRGKRIAQAKNAMKYCLRNLTENDRFSMLNFATAVNQYSNNLQNATKGNLEAAAKWVDNLEPTGGTNINQALLTALGMRSNDITRTFTVVFFTDGMPTIDETKPDVILKNVAQKNSSNTRIFTFGVGDDVNAALLDALADSSKATSSYVRENEDIEAKVSSLYGKISHPVFANLKLAVGKDVTISEVYPPSLPDLFHGSQVIVFGRYTGQGEAAVTLTGQLGKENQEFTYKVNFAHKTTDEKGFVEDLWARRKVGYLLDQVRLNGEKKELVDEIVALAKRHGITTPYTSYLMVPDNVPIPPKVAGGNKRQEMPNVGFGGGGGGGLIPGTAPLPLSPSEPGGKTTKLDEFLKKNVPAESTADKDGKGAGGVASARDNLFESRLRQAEAELDKLKADVKKDPSAEKSKQLEDAEKHLKEVKEQRTTLALTQGFLSLGQYQNVQQGGLGVNWAIQNNALRSQDRLATQASSRIVNSRNCIDVGGIWIDDAYNPKLESVVVKAQSKAYFRMLELQPKMRDVFRLGNYLVWVAPSGKALVIDANDGREEMNDADIQALFVPTTPPAVTPKK